MYQALTPDLPFPLAFKLWMQRRTVETDLADPDAGFEQDSGYWAPDTLRDYWTNFEALKIFFQKPIGKIKPDDLFRYQNARRRNAPNPDGEWRCLRMSTRSGAEAKRPTVRGKFATREEAEAFVKAHAEGDEEDWAIRQTLWAYRAGNNCIRKEVALLIRILKAARLWGEEEERQFQRLRPVDCDLDFAMTVPEQHRLLHVGGSRPELQYAYQYAIVALQSTAGPNEMRWVKLGGVFVEGLKPRFQIPRRGAKNKHRAREIPLVTREAVWAMRGLVERAWRMGARGPGDFLFPLMRRNRTYDPARPMTECGFKKPWDALRRAAGMPLLRLYALRHTGITRMAEAGVPLPVAMSFAGHMTLLSQRRYTAIQMEAKDAWGALVWGPGVSRQSAIAEAVAGVGRKKPMREESLPEYRNVQLFHDFK
jgi:hypothetical protein